VTVRLNRAQAAAFRGAMQAGAESGGTYIGHVSDSYTYVSRALWFATGGAADAATLHINPGLIGARPERGAGRPRRQPPPIGLPGAASRRPTTAPAAARGSPQCRRRMGLARAGAAAFQADELPWGTCGGGNGASLATSGSGRG
jgi:hypothetical protein